MILERMRYKSFVWPHNPRTYSIAFSRPTAVHKIPHGRYAIQDLGLGCRILKGEGEFVGEGAYDTFKKLASLFYEGGPGLLVHPVWQSAWVYFTELSLVQEPVKDYVRYRFAFQEAPSGVRAALTAYEKKNGAAAGEVKHIVARGENLWAIAEKWGVGTEQLLRLNPQIKNPGRLKAGEEVRIPQ